MAQIGNELRKFEQRILKKFISVWEIPGQARDESGKYNKCAPACKATKEIEKVA
jgi:hypothetical protein